MCDLSAARAREQPDLLAALQAAKLDDAAVRPLRPLTHRLRRAFFTSSTGSGDY